MATPEFRHVSIEFGCEEEGCSPETVPEHWTRNRHVSATYVVQSRMRPGNIYETIEAPVWSEWSDRQFLEEDTEERARIVLGQWRESRAHRKDMQFRLIKRTDWLVEQ